MKGNELYERYRATFYQCATGRQLPTNPAWIAIWGHLYPPESPQYQQWLAQNTQVAAQFHHQQYERPCTCHPSEAPVPCEHRYAFSECEQQARWRNFYCVV